MTDARVALTCLAIGVVLMWMTPKECDARVTLTRLAIGVVLMCFLVLVGWL